MRKIRSIRKALVMGSMALFMAATTHAATVFETQVIPAFPFNWSAGADNTYLTTDDFNNQWGQIDLRNGGTAAVTADYPRSGNGSLKLAANGGALAKAGVAYYPGTQTGFGALNTISAASFDWMRATGSAATDASPVMRLFLFDPGTNTHRATLLWMASNDGVAVTDDTWQTTNVLTGRVWDTKAGGTIAAPGQLFTAVQALPAYSNLIVRAVEVGFGSGGWGTTFVGAVDNVVLTGGVAAVNDNFEMSTVALTVNVGANGTATIGSANAAGTQTVNVGNTATIAITPATGFVIDQTTGCGGSLEGTTFTTAAFSVNCTVDITFKAAPVVVPPVTPVTPATTNPVPTLGEWGIALLSLLTLGFGALRMRRRD